MKTPVPKVILCATRKRVVLNISDTIMDPLLERGPVRDNRVHETLLKSDGLYRHVLVFIQGSGSKRWWYAPLYLLGH